MLENLVVIAGPTATGKTSLGLHLARYLNVDVISADSRQLYKEMDIGTGKDLPKNSTFTPVDTFKVESSEYAVGFYDYDGVKVWLYDVAYPDQVFSTGHYYQAVETLIPHLKDQSTAVMVGGTGLYINALLHPPENLRIPPNHALREMFRSFSLSQLKSHLEKEDPQKYSSMNKSDKNNPRRLIRALEVAHYQSKNKDHTPPPALATNYRKFALKLDQSILNKKITSRVNDRLKVGVIEEVESVNASYPHLSPQAKSALGYKQISLYLNGKMTKKEAIEQWIIAEQQYAARQMTWFKKDKEYHWLNATDKQLKSNVVGLVQEWYSRIND